MNVRVGQGFSYGRGYGLVLNYDGKYVSYVSVKDPVYDNSYTQQAYDELEAKYDTDKDNLRLKSCPPPFSDISYNGFSDNKGKPIAIADMNNIKHISIEMFEFGSCKILDNGVQISYEDMAKVKNHPWPRQKEIEKTYDRNEALRELTSGIDMSYDGGDCRYV